MSLSEELYKRPSANQWNQPAQPGLEIAEVVDLKDPEKLGRVKCQRLTDEKGNNSDWCYVMAPLAGKDHGIQFMPDVGDLVVLGYISGDRQRPLVLGCLWNNKQPMPHPIQDGKNFNFAVKTPIGIEVLMSGEKKEEAKLTVKTPAETVLDIDDKEKTITISDKDKKNYINIKLKNGEIVIAADKKITLDAGKGKATLTLDGSGQSVKASSKKEVALDAPNIKLAAKTKLEGSGGQTKLSATGVMEVSGATTNIKGSAGVNLN